MSPEAAPPPTGEDGGGDTLESGATLFERLADLPVRLVAWLAMAVIVGMMALVTTDIVLRSFAGRSLMVVEELVGWLTVAMAFLGAPYALRRHALLRVDVFRGRLSPRMQALVDAIFNLASLVYVGLVVWFGWLLVESSSRLGIVSLSQLRLPLWIPQLVLPVGGAILALALVAEEVRDIRRVVALWRAPRS